MTEPLQPAIQTEHATHDAMRIAALVTRDAGLAPADLVAGRAELQACDACADLYAELVAVAAAVPSAALPARPRDFTVTAADAARLRPAIWRRVLRAIGSARDGVTFPLATGLTTLGIAGLLVATVPTLSGGATSGATTTLSTVGQALPSGAAAAESTESERMSGEPDTTGDAQGGVFAGGDDGDAAMASPGAGTAAVPTDASIRDDRTGLSVLNVVAGALLIAGLGLFALRWSAGRLGDG